MCTQVFCLHLGVIPAGKSCRKRDTDTEMLTEIVSSVQPHKYQDVFLQTGHNSLHVDFSPIILHQHLNGLTKKKAKWKFVQNDISSLPNPPY